MSKRKDPKRRTPGTLDRFARDREAAERLTELDVVFESMRPDDGDPAVAETPTALEQLSALIGREVSDVGRPKIYRHDERGPGVHQPLGWTVWWATGGHSITFESHDLRRENRLNEVALTHWRRPLDLPRLTSDDGRRLARLLHEVIEAKQAAHAAETSTNGDDR